jgi:hypothetical protein
MVHQVSAAGLEIFLVYYEMAAEKIATTTVTKTDKGFTIDIEIQKNMFPWLEYITPALLLLILIKR